VIEMDAKKEPSTHGHKPFLLRFKESDDTFSRQRLIASPERGGESNPKEEAPKPEPTRKGPYGD
jgi:hypothetical protein